MTTLREWLQVLDASWYGSSKKMSKPEFFRRQLALGERETRKKKKEKEKEEVTQGNV